MDENPVEWFEILICFGIKRCFPKLNTKIWTYQKHIKASLSPHNNHPSDESGNSTSRRTTHESNEWKKLQTCEILSCETCDQASLITVLKSHMTSKHKQEQLYHSEVLSDIHSSPIHSGSSVGWEERTKLREKVTWQFTSPTLPISRHNKTYEARKLKLQVKLKHYQNQL